ncbi:AtpZ/AtpI family protein [Candidatus Uhrbacteria bacterium]|nr:AtpZ/AtpI family protein [Candidatus Uhrbacteria bacterium]
MPNPEQRSPFWQAVALAWELGYTIAIPIVLLALGGRFLDRRFGTSPWLLLLGILLSIIVSSIAITMKVRRIIR